MVNPRTGKQVRCRLHGGACTGPVTAKGAEVCRKANWKHGRRSRAEIAAHRKRLAFARMLIGQVNELDPGKRRLSTLSESDREFLRLRIELLQQPFDAAFDACFQAQDWRLLARIAGADTRVLTLLARLEGLLN
jgi:hypothetical protein